MKSLLLALILLPTIVSAQLPNGSIAPDFTATDLNGNTHNLYSVLDSGYTVVLDFCATWCPPCWFYDESDALNDLWNNYGPDGTDEVRVFYIEADLTTDIDDLNGTGTNTMGDYVSLTEFPIIDLDSSNFYIANPLFGLNYYPTVYTICPDRIVTETGQASTAEHYAFIQGNCFAASEPTNPALLSYVGDAYYCDSVDVIVELQNRGTDTLTAATIEVFDGATSLISYNWTGSLSTYEIESVNCGVVNPTNATNYSVVITSANDDLSDDTLTQVIQPPYETDYMVTVNLHTDLAPEETYVEITNEAGDIIWFQGNENVQGGNYDTGIFPPPLDPTNPLQDDTLYSWNVWLPAIDCYTFTIYDYYGDGFGWQMLGEYDVLDNNGNILFSGINVDFGGMEVGGKIHSNSISIDELDHDLITIYPNPASNEIRIAGVEHVSYAIFDLAGRVILEGMNDSAIDVSHLPSATYLVKVFVEGSIVTKLLVRQ